MTWTNLNQTTWWLIGQQKTWMRQINHQISGFQPLVFQQKSISDDHQMLFSIVPRHVANQVRIRLTAFLKPNPLNMRWTYVKHRTYRTPSFWWWISTPELKTFWRDSRSITPNLACKKNRRWINFAINWPRWSLSVWLSSQDASRHADYCAVNPRNLNLNLISTFTSIKFYWKEMSIPGIQL